MSLVTCKKCGESFENTTGICPGCAHFADAPEYTNGNNAENSAACGTEGEKTKEELISFYTDQGLLFCSGSEKNLKSAAECFEKAMRLGSKTAEISYGKVCNAIGFCLYSAKAPDLEGAEEFFKKAKEAGNKSAEKNLSILYNQYGLAYAVMHGEKYSSLAQEYFTRAYNLGSAAAETNLIKLHIDMFFNNRYGLGGYIKDKVNAEKHLESAKNINGEKVREIALDYLNSGTKGIEKGIDKSNYKSVISHIKRARRLGADVKDETVADLYYTVYTYYKKGKNGFKKDKERAGHYLRHAAAYGHPSALKKVKR